jgi:DNA replication and repair protein RecF
MPLTRLEITDFRNLATIKLEPVPTGFNLIYGMNGSGKTSLLEAIYYLSLGRSFRGSLTSRIVRHTTDKFLIFAQKLLLNDQTVPIGIERALQGDLKIRVAGNDVQSIADLADLTPLQLINSQCFSLLDGGPVVRRKYLDWGVFYYKADFFRAWRDFAQALKQRNAALRSQRPAKEIEIWTQELVAKACQLDELRREYIGRLLPLLHETLEQMISLSGLEISYYAGWDDAVLYADVLGNSIDKDRYAGYTQFGPHRADFKVKIGGVPAKDILSRGQQKLFVCAMILAQGALLHSCANKKPIYLIDDLPAELDSVSRTRLIALLSQQETQVFVTAVECESLSAALAGLPCKMFHVEHGQVAGSALSEPKLSRVPENA